MNGPSLRPKVVSRFMEFRELGWEDTIELDESDNEKDDDEADVRRFRRLRTLLISRRFLDHFSVPPAPAEERERPTLAVSFDRQGIYIVAVDCVPAVEGHFGRTEDVGLLLSLVGNAPRVRVRPYNGDDKNEDDAEDAFTIGEELRRHQRVWAAISGNPRISSVHLNLSSPYIRDSLGKQALDVLKGKLSRVECEDPLLLPLLMQQRAPLDCVAVVDNYTLASHLALAFRLFTRVLQIERVCGFGRVDAEKPFKRNDVLECIELGWLFHANEDGEFNGIPSGFLEDLHAFRALNPAIQFVLHPRTYSLHSKKSNDEFRRRFRKLFDWTRSLVDEVEKGGERIERVELGVCLERPEPPFEWKQAAAFLTGDLGLVQFSMPFPSFDIYRLRVQYTGIYKSTRINVHFYWGF